MDDQVRRLQNELIGKIQSLSNWINILDSTALDTAYGVLLVDRRKDTRRIWSQLTHEVEEVLRLSAQIKSADAGL